MAYTDYQQRALYGAGQDAARAGQRFHMERQALERGDKAAAKYHRSRANALNRQGAYAAVRGMGGDQGANQYFGVDSSGQPIRTAEGVALSSAGRDVFDQFRDVGFVEPIRQKKRYAPNTEPRGLGFLIDKIASNTLMGKILGSMGRKKTPEPDDAYYSSLWGKGLNEMYGPSGIFTPGKFLGDAEIDPYYSGDADTPLDYVPYDIVTKLVEGETKDEVKDISLDYDWTDLWMKDREDDLLGENFIEPDDITEKIVEEGVDEPLEKFTDLGDTHMFTENFGMAFDATDYADVQEYVNSILQDETNPYYGMDQDELVKELIKQNRIKEKSENEYDNILNQQAEELNNLEDINRQIQIEKDKQEELGFKFGI